MIRVKKKRRKVDIFERLLRREIRGLKKFGTILIDAEWVLMQYRTIFKQKKKK